MAPLVFDSAFFHPIPIQVTTLAQKVQMYSVFTYFGASDRGNDI